MSKSDSIDNKDSYTGTSKAFVNLCWLSLIAFIEAFQCVVVLALLFHYFPTEGMRFQQVALPETWAHFRPEHEMLLFRFWILATLGILGIMVLIFSQRLLSMSLIDKLKNFLIVEGAITFVIFGSLFKMAVYENPIFAQRILVVSLVLAIVNKICWCKLGRWYAWCWHKIMTVKISPRSSRWIDVIVPAGLMLLLYIPNREAMIANLYVIDRFYHWDSFIMAPAWAFLKGAILNVDVFSQYGNGMVILVSSLSRWLGGFTYPHVLLTMILLAVIYFSFFYLLLVLWLKSRLLGVLGLVLALRLHLFSLGVDDGYIIWKYPSGTLVRFLPDIFSLTCVWLHVEKQRHRFLLGGAGCVGIAIFYMTDIGIYLLMSLYGYLVLVLASSTSRYMLYKTPKDIFVIAGYALLPIVIAVSLMWFHAGFYIGQAAFWQNMMEYIQLSLEGYDALPVGYSLQLKAFFPFFMGLVIFGVYLLTFSVQAGLHVIGKSCPAGLFSAVLSIYGLCLFHYYIFRSAVASYYGVCLPFVGIICYWLSCFLHNHHALVRRKILFLSLTIAVLVLLSKQSCLVYPNVFNLAGTSFQSQLQQMHEDLVIEDDVRMITRLTDPQQKVCLLSSFETAILMQADRKPFFYYFPLMSPRFLRMMDYGGMKIVTHRQWQKVLDELETEPSRVFIEKKLFRGQIPKIYYERYPSLTRLIGFLAKYYEPEYEGRYLMCLKRKE
jgi:hypothetical protein